MLEDNDNFGENGLGTERTQHENIQNSQPTSPFPEAQAMAQEHCRETRTTWPRPFENDIVLVVVKRLNSNFSQYDRQCIMADANTQL